MGFSRQYLVILFFVMIFWLRVNSLEEKTKIASVLWNPTDNKYKLVEGKIVPGSVASATFSDQTQENGWSFLRVVTNEIYPDNVQAYAAGLVEGHLTGKHMRYFWESFVSLMCDPLTGSSIDLCDQIWQFLRINKHWTEENIRRFARTEPYWHQVELMMRQMEGIEDGCRDKSFIKSHSNNILFEEFGFWLFTFVTDVDELLIAKFNATLQHVNNHPGSCSALIKPLANNTDLYVAHDMWWFYTAMVRIIKNYEFYYHFTDFPASPVIPGFNISFSSYPGAIQSLDDYYLISSGLVTLETTIGIFNERLLDFIQPQSVLECFRVMLANRLAVDGKTWTSLFTKHNSGTYNNQWMIVNYNLFQPGNPILYDGLLWIVEQIPGRCESADVTSVLRDQGYWASYNIPYFETIYELSGQSQLDVYGPILSSYNESYRALIFRREQGKVKDIDSMIKVMRFNDYENDPYSICPNCTPRHNAMMSIAARSDLNPVNGSYDPDSLRHYAFGAIDMKLTNYTMVKSLQFIAISGPTHETQPVFQWSTYDSQGLKIKHPGQPDRWDFQPVVTVWN